MPNSFTSFRLDMTRAFIMACLCVFLAACSQNPAKDIDPDLNKVAAKSTATDNFHPDASSRFCWFNDVVIYKDDDIKIRENSLEMVRGALQTGLQERNYTFTTDVNAAHYNVLATVVIGNKMHLKEIGDKFGLKTHAKASEVHFERGTLALVIFKGVDSHILWSGAVQIFTDPNLEQDIAQQRVEKAIATLLDELPEIK